MIDADTTRPVPTTFEKAPHPGSFTILISRPIAGCYLSYWTLSLSSPCFSRPLLCFTERYFIHCGRYLRNSLVSVILPVSFLPVRYAQLVLFLHDIVVGLYTHCPRRISYLHTAANDNWQVSNLWHCCALGSSELDQGECCQVQLLTSNSSMAA